MVIFFVRSPEQRTLKHGINGRVLGQTVGAWCEVSEDFDLILDLIAHALADEETSTIQVPHHQSVARQKSKLVADFGLMMHLTWARQLLDNREFVLVEGRHPSSDPNHGRDDAGYDSEEESCLVLSINLIHCGNEFRNSVPVRTLGL